MMTEDGRYYDETHISICKYDVKSCGCATHSILSNDKTHYNCGKCGATK